MAQPAALGQRRRDAVEGQLLVFVGLDGPRAHPLQELGECLLGCHLDADHDHVDEEANHALSIKGAAIGQRHAHGNILSAGHARQGCVERRQVHHGRRCIEGCGALAYAGHGGPPEAPQQVATPEGLFFGVRPITVERQGIGQISQPFGPVRTQRVANVCCEQGPLGQRYVDGPGTHRRKRCCSIVGKRDLSEENVEGPAVCGDVMHRQAKEPRPVGEGEEVSPQERSVGEIKRHACCRACQAHGLIAPAFHALLVELGRHGWSNDLKQRSGFFPKHCTKGLVPRHHCPQCGLEAHRREFAAQFRRADQVVHGITGPQMIDERQALLGEGGPRALLERRGNSGWRGCGWRSCTCGA